MYLVQSIIHCSFGGSAAEKVECHHPVVKVVPSESCISHKDSGWRRNYSSLDTLVFFTISNPMPTRPQYHQFWGPTGLYLPTDQFFCPGDHHDNYVDAIIIAQIFTCNMTTALHF